jgi:hypothetical protein
MLLGLGILSIAFGWLLLYGGFAGVGIRAELGHIFNPSKFSAPHPSNPRVK